MTADQFRVGDTVIIAERGQWFGHCGPITRITRSEHTDLLLHTVAGAGDAWYADELAPAPHDNPALLVPPGPARDVVHAAQQAGWMTHVAGTDPVTLALISGPDAGGTYLRVRVKQCDVGGEPVDRWRTHTETFDAQANLNTSDWCVRRTCDLIATIDRHGHTP